MADTLNFKQIMVDTICYTSLNTFIFNTIEIKMLKFILLEGGSQVQPINKNHQGVLKFESYLYLYLKCVDKYVVHKVIWL